MPHQHPPKEIMLTHASGTWNGYLVMGEYPPRVVYTDNPIPSQEGLYSPVIRFRPDSAENRYVFNEILPLYSSYWYLPKKQIIPFTKKSRWQRLIKLF